MLLAGASCITQGHHAFAVVFRSASLSCSMSPKCSAQSKHWAGASTQARVCPRCALGCIVRGLPDSTPCCLSCFWLRACYNVPTQVRADELEQPVKVVKKRSLPAGGGGSGRSRGAGRGGWGPWQRSLSSSSTKTDPDKDTESAPPAAGSMPAAAAADDGDQGPEKGDNMQRLYGLWQTEPFVRRAEDGKVPKNDRGNIEVPPFAKALPLGEPVVHLAIQTAWWRLSLRKSQSSQIVSTFRPCTDTVVGVCWASRFRPLMLSMHGAHQGLGLPSTDLQEAVAHCKAPGGCLTAPDASKHACKYEWDEEAAVLTSSLWAWPAGTKWIDAPNVAPICRSLGVDYAPALVGFEVQGGRMVPRIRGVVVCEVSGSSMACVPAAWCLQRLCLNTCMVMLQDPVATTNLLDTCLPSWVPRMQLSTCIIHHACHPSCMMESDRWDASRLHCISKVLLTAAALVSG